MYGMVSPFQSPVFPTGFNSMLIGERMIHQHFIGASHFQTPDSTSERTEVGWRPGSCGGKASSRFPAPVSELLRAEIEMFFLTHRIRMYGILMVNVTIYIAYMDPMG